MAFDATAGAWELVNIIQVAGGDALWQVEFALALYQKAYYLRVRTQKAGHAEDARVRIVGPYPDMLRALAAVQDLVHAAPRGSAGAVQCAGPDAATAGPDNR